MTGSRTVSLICKGSRAHLPLRPTVEDALNAVGEGNIIFGGLVIVALTAIGAFVFTSVQSGGAHATRRNHIGLAVGNRARDRSSMARHHHERLPVVATKQSGL
jgi:hypothetical protein